jgi:NAD(P)-dependent dehydrogenase (short-subunit alcohol dehydrogenase family)
MSTIIVTGASGGIGAEVARLASARGVPVAVHFLQNKRAAEALVEQIDSAGGRALALQADIGREQDVVRLFDTAARELGPVAGLVNSAGVVGALTRVENVTAAALEEVFRVNVIGSTTRHPRARLTASRWGWPAKWRSRESASTPCPLGLSPPICTPKPARPSACNAWHPAFR